MRDLRRIRAALFAVLALACLVGQAAVAASAGNDGQLAASAAGPSLDRRPASLTKGENGVSWLPGQSQPSTPISGPTAQGSRSGPLLSQTFEAAWPTGSWEVLDGDGSTHGEYYWDEDDFKPHAGSFSAWAANGGDNGLDPSTATYPNYMDSWMTYGPLDLRGYTHPYIDFYWWNQSELGADYLFWGASGDDLSYQGWEVSGDSEGWIHESFDLTDWAGDASVWIAFVFQSNGSVVGAGPFVDDIYVFGQMPGPGAFSKVSPAANATGQSTNPVLTWTEAFLATSYQYCYDTTNDGACSPWREAGEAPRVTLYCLAPNTAYYWQVRAVNPTGMSYANGSDVAFRKFTTGASNGRPCGADSRISGPQATARETSADVAWNSTGNEYLVVWSDNRNCAKTMSPPDCADPSTSGKDVYGRRVGADGVGIANDIRITWNPGTADEDWPAVAWNGTANEYLVVWRDTRQGTYSPAIYGRRFTAGGVPIGRDLRVSGAGATFAALYMDSKPDIAWNSTANEYLVVWQDTRNTDTRGMDIYGRRLSATGSPLGGDFRISGSRATGNERQPAVAWNETAGEYLVVWTDMRNQSTRGSDVFGRRLGADGSAAGGDFLISGPNASSEDYAPAVACNSAANEYLVVWTDWRNYGTRDADIYGRRLQADGAGMGRDTRISGPNATAEEQEPAVAWNPVTNRYLVVWNDARDLGTRSFDVYGRQVSASGTVVGADFRISGPTATQIDQFAAVAWNQAFAQYFVVWEDERGGGARDYDIYGRRVAP